MQGKGLMLCAIFIATLSLTQSQRVFKSTYQPIKPSSMDSSSYANVDVVKLTFVELIARVSFDAQTIAGKSTMTFTAIQDCSEIILDMQGINVTNVTSNTIGKFTEGEQWTVFEVQEDPVLGNALRVYLADKANAGDTIKLNVVFLTTNQSLSINWLTPAQTSSKTQKYMYTKCEPSHCRAILPLQDTPSVKFTYNAAITVNKVYSVNMSANCTEVEVMGDERIYRFTSQIPIPSYLFAIVIGNLTTVAIDERTNVISEPDKVHDYAKVLGSLGDLLNKTEKYVGVPYIWGKYNILVLPPSFPVGGMENPLLTFASPTVMVEDQSQIYVATHEIAHSWTGNMVTCRDWNNMWLNEGFTTFIERKISAEVYGDDFAKQENQIGNQSLYNDMASFGYNHPYSSLYPQIGSSNPDNAGSEVPYEKGNQFLTYIESLMNDTTHFQEFLTLYINNFAYKSITFLDTRLFFNSFLKTKYGDYAETIIDKIDWTAWVQTPGPIPVTTLNFTTEEAVTFSTMAQNYIDLNGYSSPPDYLNYTTEKNVILKEIFHDKLLENADYLTYRLISRVDKDLNATNDPNPEIGQRWFPTVIANNYETAFPQIQNYVSTIGRQKYILPVYKALVRNGYRSQAYTWYKLNENFYHPIAAAKIRAIIQSSNEEIDDIQSQNEEEDQELFLY